MAFRALDVCDSSITPSLTPIRTSVNQATDLPVVEIRVVGAAESANDSFRSSRFLEKVV